MPQPGMDGTVRWAGRLEDSILACSALVELLLAGKFRLPGWFDSSKRAGIRCQKVFIYYGL